MIGFDLLTPAASVSALTAAQFAVDKRLIDAHAGGKSFDEDDKALAVRFTSGAVTQRCHSQVIVAETAVDFRSVSGV